MGDRAELRKQLRTYADGITAFAVLQSVAFGIALGGKDFRESVLKLSPCQIGVMCAVGFALYILFVAGCHRGENQLKPEANADTKAEKWITYVQVARFGVITIAQALIFVAVYFTFHGARVAAAAAAAAAHTPGR